MNKHAILDKPSLNDLKNTFNNLFVSDFKEELEKTHVDLANGIKSIKSEQLTKDKYLDNIGKYFNNYNRKVDNYISEHCDDSEIVLDDTDNLGDVIAACLEYNDYKLSLQNELICNCKNDVVNLLNAGLTECNKNFNEVKSIIESNAGESKDVLLDRINFAHNDMGNQLRQYSDAIKIGLNDALCCESTIINEKLQSLIDTNNNQLINDETIVTKIEKLRMELIECLTEQYRMSVAEQKKTIEKVEELESQNEELRKVLSSLGEHQKKIEMINYVNSGLIILLFLGILTMKYFL